MSDNQENRERSRSRDGQTDFNEDEVRGDNHDDNFGDSRRERNNEAPQHEQRSDAEVHNLYVTNLSFQVTIPPV